MVSFCKERAQTSIDLMVQMMQNNSKHLYRIGLYGAKNHGKSCFLAALGCLRQVNPRKHVCRRLPRTSSKELENSDALERGYDWVEKAENLLMNAQVPPATPIGEEPIALRYQFTFADKRKADIELIDYSGELLSSDIQTGIQAEDLRRRMDEMDAIFVLAPYPIDGEANSMPKELNDLGSVFSLLQADKNKDYPPIPIALVVNKWDRRDSTDPQDYEAQLLALKTFFEDEEASGAYLTLHNQLSGFSKNKENFSCFPLSSFGEHSNIKGIDVPKLEGADSGKDSCLSSFGMEDPFAWAIDRRDEIDREEMERQAEGTMLLSKWNPCRIQAIWEDARKTSQSCQNLRIRYPQDDERLQSSATLVGKLRRLKRQATLIFPLCNQSLNQWYWMI